MKDLNLKEYDITDIICEIERKFKDGKYYDYDMELLIEFSFGLKYKDLMDRLKFEHFLKVIGNYTFEQIESLIP